MNINEIYLISDLIDDNPVFSLAPPPKVKMLHDAAIESLIQKGLLKNAESFTDKGVMAAKRLADYKTAKKYVKLGDLTLGLLDKSQCVLLSRDRMVADYDLVRIDIVDGAKQLLKSYDFIDNARCSIGTTDEFFMDEADVKTKYGLGFANCVYLSTLTIVNPAVITNELIFQSEGQLYLFDRDSKRLSKKNQEQIQELFEERLAV